ncbi:hypothetical protein HPHPA27_0344 [Helicobacter pylori Hp A-27]|nr:hypothetical protein HPHPA27_0344 [Helicobacter pylori Hp A-27]
MLVQELIHIVFYWIKKIVYLSVHLAMHFILTATQQIAYFLLVAIKIIFY